MPTSRDTPEYLRAEESQRKLFYKPLTDEQTAPVFDAHDPCSFVEVLLHKREVKTEPSPTTEPAIANTEESKEEKKYEPAPYDDTLVTLLYGLAQLLTYLSPKGEELEIDFEPLVISDKSWEEEERNLDRVIQRLLWPTDTLMLDSEHLFLCARAAISGFYRTH